MPRRSASELELVDTVLNTPRLPAPVHLTEDQRRSWQEITSSYPSSHFGPDCAPLLEELVVHIGLAQQLAMALRETRTWNLIAHTAAAARRRETFATLLQEARAESATISSLSVKLRLTPSSHRRAPGHVDERKLTVLPTGPRPWER
jgi:hypothetical protein